MVEKWLKSKPNPYIRNPSMKRPFRGNSSHYGMPNQLFKDSDKDGVMNVFDCKPRNKRKQDVIAPFQGGNPYMEMLARQESARQSKAYQRQLDELRRLEELRNAELVRLSNVTVIDKTVYVPEPVSMVPKQTSSGKYVWIPSNTKEGQKVISEWNAPVKTTKTSTPTVKVSSNEPTPMSPYDIAKIGQAKTNAQIDLTKGLSQTSSGQYFKAVPKTTTLAQDVGKAAKFFYNKIKGGK